MIPGEDIQIVEKDLIAEVGRLHLMLDLEQRKRLELVKAYVQLKEEYGQFEAKLNEKAKKV